MECSSALQVEGRVSKYLIKISARERSDDYFASIFIIKSFSSYTFFMRYVFPG